MKQLFIYLGIILSIPAFSQQTHIVTGTVQDTTGLPLSGATVKLVSLSDTLATSIDINGGFRFSKVKANAFKITAELLGYKPFTDTYTISDPNAKTFKINTIKLKVWVNLLGEVTVVGINPIKIKEDTIEYKASAYAVREGAPVEDVVKKLPGVAVDKDGNITAQGKAITRIRVNGKDFFGGDVQTATQNLPADVIDNIQIIDDYGDQANLTGVKTGDPEKILNINVQKGKNKGSFGNGTLAGGNEGRYMGRLMASNFKDERQLSLIGALNNTNVNAFNFNGGGRGGGARGANFGGGGGNSGGNGITISQSLGLNYRDNWGKKITSYGSYSFSSRNNNTIGTSFQQDLDTLHMRTTSGNSSNKTNSFNQRLTWNVEYKIDTANFIKVTPYFSYGNSGSNSRGISDISTPNYYTLSHTKSQNNSYSPSGGSEFLFNHKFDKRGRNFSISSSVDYSSSNQDRAVFNTYHDIDSTSIIPFVKDSIQNQAIGNDNKNTKTNIRTSYSEPISKTSFLEVSYAWNKSSSRSIRDVNDIDSLSEQPILNSGQSNNYKYQFVTNRMGLNFRSVKTKYNYTLGLIAQPSNLEGFDIGRNIRTSNSDFNLIPNARFVYNFSKSHSLSINYGGSSREPSFNQLQPVRDSSNRNNIIIGNPSLNAEFTNRFSIQYNKFDIASGNSLFSNLSFDQTQNKIVTNRANNPRGTGRTTSYLNTDGFYGINGNISYSKPFAERKYTITVSSTANYDNNISFTDNLRNQGQNWMIRPATRFRMDLKDIIDIDLNASYLINKTITASKTDLAKSLTLGVNGKNYFFKDYTLGYDFSKIINSGYIGINSNPVLLNVYFEYRFLKNNMGTLRFQGFDLFNQNTGLSREVDGTITTYSQNNRLGRYFLLSFNLRLQKFAGKRPEFQRDRNGEGGRMRNGGGGGYSE